MDIQFELAAEINKAKSLIDLCQASGLTTPTVDIDTLIASGDVSPEDKLRALKQANRNLHEVLYAPPRTK